MLQLILSNGSLCGCRAITARTFLLPCQHAIYGLSRHRSYVAHTPGDTDYKYHLKNSVPKAIHMHRLSFESRRGMQTESSQDNFDSDPSWSTIGKRLLALWGGTAVAIVVIYVAQQSIQDKETAEEQRKQRLQRMKDKKPLEYWVSMPCMRNTLLLAIGGAFISFIVTFLLTSNARLSYQVGGLSPFVIGTAFFIYCTIASSSDRSDREQLAKILSDVQKKRVGEKVDDKTDD